MHLIFAGSPGDPACAAELRQLVRREGLQENVTWMDFQEDVRPLICAADVVILPSDREPLGTCILEGMSLEKPVVVSDAGGTAELMEDGASGLIMRGGDPTSLAGALRRLAENRSFAAELARNGRRRVCEQFSVRAHGMAVSKLLARFA
jgi:glycosyltransferase involved in cell wall biosynthesis